jgi:hypothetical protein
VRASVSKGVGVNLIKAQYIPIYTEVPKRNPLGPSKYTLKNEGRECKIDLLQRWGSVRRVEHKERVNESRYSG